MIRELICYKCTCSKCGHSWTTKTHALPVTCAGPKCRSVKWNDDYSFDTPTAVEPPKLTPTIQPPNDVMAFIAKAQAAKGIAPKIETVEEVIEEWQFTSDKPTQQETGDWLRYQYLVSNPKKRRIVQVDEEDYSCVKRVM